MVGRAINAPATAGTSNPSPTRSQELRTCIPAGPHVSDDPAAVGHGHRAIDAGGMPSGAVEVGVQVGDVLQIDAERQRRAGGHQSSIVGNDGTPHLRPVQDPGQIAPPVIPHACTDAAEPVEGDGRGVDLQRRQEAEAHQPADGRPAHRLVEHIPKPLAIQTVGRGRRAEADGAGSGVDDPSPLPRRHVMRLVGHQQVKRRQPRAQARVVPAPVEGGDAGDVYGVAGQVMAGRDDAVADTGGRQRP